MSDMTRLRMPQASRAMSGIGPGTPVMTPDGLIPAGRLAPGDRIVTYDRGVVRLDHVGICHVPARAALLVRPRVLDPADETPDMVIAAAQRLLLRDWRARAMFGTGRALVRASRLVDGSYIARLTGAAPMPLVVLGFAGAEHVIQLGGRLEMISARAVAPVR
jgi:hypothetical protein